VERRDVAVLVLALLVNVARGSTRLGVRGSGAAELVSILREAGDALGGDQRARVTALAQSLGDPTALAALTPLLVSAGEPGPIVAFGEHLYPQRLFETEGRIASAVVERLRPTPSAGTGLGDDERVASQGRKLERALRDVLAAPPFAGERPFGSRGSRRGRCASRRRHAWRSSPVAPERARPASW
jgi:hypothetical protein